jgi:thymidine kinase
VHAITNSGWVEVITGSMFSGKTEELLRRLRRAEIAGQTVAVFSPAIDDRYGRTTIGSHDGRTWESTVVGRSDDTTEAADDVWAIVDHLASRETDVDVVAVDEGNFFGLELPEMCESLADDGYRVIVCGLDTTYRGEPFEPMPQLMAVAEYVDKLHAICSVCGEPATRSQRLVDGEPAHVDDPTVLVGAEESYEARCRNCHSVRRT